MWVNSCRLKSIQHMLTVVAPQNRAMFSSWPKSRPSVDAAQVTVCRLIASVASNMMICFCSDMVDPCSYSVWFRNLDCLEVKLG